jgi:sec-independent protein translocase protein TatB
MFEVGFTEIVLILGLALLVLGPEKLPGLAQKVGRWTGRARSMARQLRAQLEQEVTLEELAKTRAAQKPEPTPAPPAPEPYMEPEAYSPPHPPHDLGQESATVASASGVEPAIHTHAAAVDTPAPVRSETDPAKTHG